jgi:hypothetical protein
MSLSKVEFKEVNRITAALSKHLDLEKDLPGMVFLDSGLEYYFFERPLLSTTEVLSELVCLSYEMFSTDVFTLFSTPPDCSCYLFDGNNVEEGVEALSSGFRDFFKGTVDYPMIMGNLGFDWLLFESAYEEFGVLALSTASAKLKFSEGVGRNLIHSKEFQGLKGRDETLDKIIDAFHVYFEGKGGLSPLE